LSAVIAAAGAVRGRLESRGLQSFVKTSVGRTPRSWFRRTIRRLGGSEIFYGAIAEAMAADHPTVCRDSCKACRRGRVFIDYLRNDPAYGCCGILAPLIAAGIVSILWSGTNFRKTRSTTSRRQRENRLLLKRDPWRAFFTVRQRIPVGRA